MNNTKTRIIALVMSLIVIIASVSYYTKSTPKYSCDNIANLEKLSLDGKAGAQLQLGECYAEGKGVEQNYTKAFEYFIKAADQGNIFAQFNLGIMYDNGLGVTQNYSKAFEYYQKAADQGYDYGQFNLGIMYDNGEGVEQNYAKAVEYYQKAFDQGNTSAAFNLGLMHYNGTGIEQNHSKAAEYFQKAADQGHASAKNNLGVMYQHGQGVQKNLMKAAELIQNAADQGNELAKDNLKDKSLHIAMPFGLTIGNMTLNQIQDKYKIRATSPNKWTGKMMYNIDPISQIDFTGIKELTLIFDNNDTLQAVLTKLDKNKFNELAADLDSKYNMDYKKNPYVGDKEANFSAANANIILISEHLEPYTQLTFLTYELKALFKSKAEEEEQAKKQKQRSML